MRLVHVVLLLALGCRSTDGAVDSEDPGDTDRADTEVDSSGTDADGDGTPAADDCDDGDAAWLAGAPELCNGVDDDCDDAVDENPTDPRTFYWDDDGDGYGEDTRTQAACEMPFGYAAERGDCDDARPDVHPGADEGDCTDPVDYNCDGSVGWSDLDGDGSAACKDCDDRDATSFPGGAEVCDGADNDCDAAVDDGVMRTWWRDGDGDRTGDPAVEYVGCVAPAGFIAADATRTDCDDGDPSRSPLLAEVCDGRDNDCDEEVDEAFDRTFWRDGDGDLAGDPTVTVAACTTPVGYVPADPANEDCDDGDADRAPRLPETCDGVDNDCDETVDEGVTRVFHADADGDGVGDPDATWSGCQAPAGYVAADATTVDCDDANAARSPRRTEQCDGVDNDCDELVDEGTMSSFWRDADRDGAGDPTSPYTGCTAPAGFVAPTPTTDCDDQDPAVNPSRTEVCDWKDNDCDGKTDEGVARTFYADGDGDGYGDPANAVTTCVAPAGFLADRTDCDDARPTVQPGATEQCNGIDDDCDGTADGHTRACSFGCGSGVETCKDGAFAGCTAPPVTTITSPLVLSGSSKFTYECLVVQSTLETAPDVTVEVKDYLRVEGSGSLVAGARTTFDVGKDVTFASSARLYATDVTIDAGGTVSLDPAARWYLQGENQRYYSPGGAPGCSTITTSSSATGGGGGGGRGGAGGSGGTCGSAASPSFPGAGGSAAGTGGAGCNCECTGPNAGGGAGIGGGGGVVTSGGGGGGNGGAGGAGARGSRSGTSYNAGAAGGGVAGPPSEPLYGGGGGGGGGTASNDYTPTSCFGRGGAGGGIARVVAAGFTNRGIVFAEGRNGDGTSPGYRPASGGGGGGAGGSLVFRVGRFDNNGGVLSAFGGTGGTTYEGYTANCGVQQPGGGGGGGGGRVFISGPPSGGSATIVARGTILVGGGDGGASGCGLPRAAAGAAGWVYPP